MPGLGCAATVQNSAPLHSVARSRNGSSGLRDGASLLLRPWMTKLRALPPTCQGVAGQRKPTTLHAGDYRPGAALNSLRRQAAGEMPTERLNSRPKW
ncbi:hypothetical protein EB230_13885 [Mesorhizobium sp. NZP2234]|nr:hypothetical protein EB230_13885 [Mesorhizobium sp. NZP2234]